MSIVAASYVCSVFLIKHLLVYRPVYSISSAGLLLPDIAF